MPRRLRHLPEPHTLVEITTRTLQGRLLLRPSEEVDKTILGAIGRALTLYDGIALHCVTVLSTHVHLLLTARDSEALSTFMCFVNGNIARKVGKLQGWTNALWARRYVPIPVLDDTAAVNRLRYHLSHGVKEGLVRRCADWPGVNSVRALIEGEPLVGTWHDASAEYEARRSGRNPQPGEFDTDYTIRLAPLECWSKLPEAEQQAKVRALIEEIERDLGGEEAPDEATVARQQAAILSRDPHHRPDRVAHSPAPACHTSCEQRLKAYRDSYAELIVAYKERAQRARRRIARLTLLPGTFAPGLGYVPVPPSAAPT